VEPTYVFTNKARVFVLFSVLFVKDLLLSWCLLAAGISWAYVTILVGSSVLAMWCSEVRPRQGNSNATQNRQP
jgi:hypothetical protein